MEDCAFIYFHKKTTPIKKPDEDLILSEEYDPRPNFIRNIRKSSLDIAKRIWDFFRNDNVYYQDNDTGEIVRNYLIFCGTAVS